MICPECGHDTSGNFCSNCGALIRAGRTPAAPGNTYGQNANGRRVKAWTSNSEDPEDGTDRGFSEPSFERPLDSRITNRNTAPQGYNRPESREERRENLRKKEKPGKSPGRESGKKSSSSRDSGKSGPSKKEVRLEQKEKKLRDSRMRDLESEVERLTVQQRLRDRRSRGDREGREDRESREGREDDSSSYGSGPDLGELAAKGAAGAVVIIARVMQLISFLLMGSMVLVMFRSFLAHGEGLGNINTLATDRNYGLALYLGFAGVALFMGVIWCLWILSRKGAGGGFRLKKYDTGRGLVPFLLCAFAVMAAGPLLSVIPPITGVLEEWQGIVAGGRAALTAVNAQRSTLMFCSSAGAVLSFIRRILLV